MNNCGGENNEEVGDDDSLDNMHNEKEEISEPTKEDPPLICEDKL